MKNPIPILLCFWVNPLFCAGAEGSLAPVIRSFVDQGIVPGAVALVADKDGVLAMEAAGYSSLEGKVPMREDAVFWIASMSKSLTGVALMMLVDEGKVSLDDPVGKYIPEFNGLEVKDADGKLRPPSHPVIVREVMNHTSGLVLASDKALVRTQVLS